MLFFTGARIVWWGQTLKVLEEGHRILMQQAFQEFAALGGQLPPHTDCELMILGNHRADLPFLRPDGTVSIWGAAVALLYAQTLPKFHHGMRQPWQHPTQTLPKVQMALHRRLLAAIIEPDLAIATEKMGGALHTLQDTYTIGHTERENNADPHSFLVRLHYSPSQIHPFISPRDRVWADQAETTLTPEAQTAVKVTVQALLLWSRLWGVTSSQTHSEVVQFVQTYAPIRGRVFTG